jgi:hypothetical protein
MSQNFLFAQLAECIVKHVDQAKRDGMANSLDHVEKIREDVLAMLAIIDEEPYEMPLHHL